MATLLEPSAATYNVWPFEVISMPIGNATLFAFSTGSRAQHIDYSVCLFRCRGVTPPAPLRTVIRLKAILPRTEGEGRVTAPANRFAPSNRCILLESRLET